MSKKMSSKSIGYLAVIVIVVIIVGGLGVYLFVLSPGSQSNVIKIGASVSLTGPLETEGTGVYNGIVLAIKDINNNGGVMVNGHRYNFSLDYINDQSVAANAKANIGTLLDSNHDQFLIGPYGSSNVLSVAPVVDAHKIPMVQAGGASDSIYTQGYQYMFGLYRLASTYTQPIFQWLNDTGKISDIHSVGVLVENEPFSLSVWTGAQKFLGNVGFSGVNSSSIHSYYHATNDLTTLDNQMQTLKSLGGANMILAIGHYADAKEVVQQIASLGLKPNIVFGTVGVDEPTFVTSLGAAGNNTLGFSQWVPNIPVSQAPGITTFTTEYNNTYGAIPSYHGAGGYAAVQVLKDAIEKANSLDPLSVRNALAALNVSTIWGNVQFTPTGYITGSGFMIQVQNTQIQTVYPPAYETSTVRYPFTS